MSKDKNNSNKANAQKSTGPRTAAGKAVVAQNAVQHGLLSRKLLLPNENPQEFQALLQQLQQEMQPVGTLELTLVERIAIAIWRQRRLVGAEAAVVELQQRQLSPLDLHKVRSLADLQPDDAEWIQQTANQTPNLAELELDVQEFESCPDDQPLQTLSVKFPRVWSALTQEAGVADVESHTTQCTMVVDYLAEGNERLRVWLYRTTAFKNKLLRLVQALATVQRAVSFPENADVFARYHPPWTTMSTKPPAPCANSKSSASKPQPSPPNRSTRGTSKRHKMNITMQTFLHVGCGPKRKNKTTRGFNTPEWKEIRFDIDESVNPDLIGTMTDMSAVASESVDAIFSSHNIEHLYPHEVGVALKEFLRVLKPDGFLVVTCPDLQAVCALVAEDKLLDAAYTSPAGPITPLDILYGHRPPMAKGNLYMAHRCGFTEKVLIGTLRACGFATVASRKRGHPNYDLYAVATKSTMAETEMRALAGAHFP